MFRNTQPLLFSPMPILNKFKFSIHQPLSLNRRESQQLLNLLTTSFRQQLETSPVTFRHTPPATQAVKGHQNGKVRGRSNSDSSNRPTDLHMNSILTNPLLAGVKEGNVLPSNNDPMVVFEKAVANGMMTLNHARLCLEAKKVEIIRSPVLSVQEGMRDSGAGRKVLKWLWASGLANDNSFLKDGKFATALMEFIVAERLQEVAWNWIKRGFTNVLEQRQPYILPVPDRKIGLSPLFYLIKAESICSNNLDSAYLCLSRAAGYLTGMEAIHMRALLGPSGRYLAYATCNPHRYLSYNQPPSESAFESFLSLIPVVTRNIQYQFAHLNVLHPTRPNADLALSYLREQDSKEAKFIKRSSELEMSLALNTAKLLLENHRYDDADWVMNYLQRHYWRELGIKDTIEKAKAEASNLQLLDTLSYA